ncbi:MAG: HTH domain-containing protein [Planctomycetaceae bacterium]
MAPPGNAKISFVELARLVLQDAPHPLSAPEIWGAAQQRGLAARLQSTGKTPVATLGARLYTDVQKPNSAFIKVGARPARFAMRSLAGSISTVPQREFTGPTVAVKQKTYKELELHPLLVWFADRNFGAHCRTVYHEKSLKKGEKHNQWIHPDVVGFALTTKDWTHEVVQLAQSTGALAARLYSFEVKVALDFPTLREYFFQAVSNSSWAHEGYLVAVEIDEDPDFRAELTRLSQSFGIGVIQFDLNDPLDSAVLLAARERTEIDWKTVDRIAAVNPDFESFIESVAKSVKINQPAVNGFDRLLTDLELEAHVKKMLLK